MSVQPNIVFVFSDQQRWDTMGCYGQPLEVTPNLDALARDGVRFEYAFTCQPVCGPARACLQTGKYATETGCVTNGIALSRSEKTLAHYLSEAGYEVGYIGKWHLATNKKKAAEVRSFETEPFHCETSAVPPDRRGGYRGFWLASDVLEFTSHSYDGHMFDGDGNARSFPAGRYRADAQTDWAIEYLRKQKKDRPFFLFLSYIEPHHQNDHEHFEGPKGSKERFRDYPVPQDLEGTEGDWREEYPDYLGCCWSLDQNVGRIREELERHGLLENTLIIYTSDHGSHFRTRNSEYKRTCHDNAIRIPMIVHGPGFQGGKVVEELVSLIDLPPTVVAAAGVTPPESMRGRPLQELLGDAPPADWPNDIFLQISESQCGRAIRTQRWKYSIWAPEKGGGAAGSDVYQESFLYDLANDPHEQRNLVADPAYAEIRGELAIAMKRRMQQAGEATPAILPAAAN